VLVFDAGMSDANPVASDGGTPRYVIGGPGSAFAVSDLRIRIWPIVATIGLALVILFPGAVVATRVTQRLGPQRAASIPFLFGYVSHAVMLAIALVLIVALSKGRISDYGLQWPPKRKSHVLAALAWGAFFGVLMTVVDHLPHILARRPPPGDLALTARSVAGWMFAEAVYVGPTEEIPFRGVLQTFLMQRTAGRVRLGRFEMHVAGVILAGLFAVAHVSTFWSGRLWVAIGQQLYAFALGILYAYWREKSGSLLAPIVAHDASDGVEYALLFLMTWAWRCRRTRSSG